MKEGGLLRPRVNFTFKFYAFLVSGVEQVLHYSYCFALYLLTINTNELMFSFLEDPTCLGCVIVYES